MPEKLRSSFSEHWNDVFKTITTDNGSEFSSLSSLEDISETLVYFAHPYTSYEKGTIERRKILGYRTPDELFEAELDRIYTTAA